MSIWPVPLFILAPTRLICACPPKQVSIKIKTISLKGFIVFCFKANTLLELRLIKYNSTKLIIYYNKQKNLSFTSNIHNNHVDKSFLTYQNGDTRHRRVLFGNFDHPFCYEIFLPLRNPDSHAWGDGTIIYRTQYITVCDFNGWIKQPPCLATFTGKSKV